MKELEEKYIDLILFKCLNFEKAKSLMIHMDLEEHRYFAEKIKRRANELGILDVYIHCNDLYKVHDYLKNTSVSNIKLCPLIDRSPWNNYAIKGGSLLFLNSDVPGLMEDISPEKMAKLVTEREKSCKYYRENVKRYVFPWCIVALPNEAWAKTVFTNDINAYEKLYYNIMKMCMVDTKNPIESWNKFINESNSYKNKLNELRITKMHFTNSIGTDLIVEKPESNVWLNLDKDNQKGIFNMPSYEIFCTPNKYKTEGVVHSSLPLSYNGNIIDEFYIEFKNGKAVNWDALEGYKTLSDLINKDSGSSYLGEIALVGKNSPIYNSGILFNTTLFDENARCHLALGGGYLKSIVGIDYEYLEWDILEDLGYNESKIHTDFMIGTDDLNIEAETIEGKKLIFKNGDFNI